ARLPGCGRAACGCWARPTSSRSAARFSGRWPKRPRPARPRRSELGRAERVALPQLAGLEAPAEPVHALPGRAVREGLRRHAALGLTLQPVVPDRRGGVERLLQIALLEDVARLLGVVRPDAGQAVGLQLDADGRRVALRAAALPRGRDLLGDAEQRLHVMADLVGDDVGLREVTGRAETIAKRAEEAEVEVELLVGGAVERTHRGARHAARRLHRAGEEHELRLAVLPAHS